ncbi:outer membrane protein assembly factor BamE [Pseudomonas luteola]|nr:outer membrane protein assembly factor BamE [Pseudomonas luteola]
MLMPDRAWPLICGANHSGTAHLALRYEQMSWRTAMYRNPVTLLCLVTLFFSNMATATTVFRCASEDGHISFSANGCLKGDTISHQTADNPKPGGNGPKTPISTQPLSSPSPAKDQLPAHHELAVVGAKEGACPNVLSGSERRTAVIHKKVIAGMTKEDVESALGKPDRIIENNNRARYYYVTQRKKHSRVISFDDAGCVADTESKYKKATP